VKTQQLITNTLHRSKLDLRANVSFVNLYIMRNVFIKKYPCFVLTAECLVQCRYKGHIKSF